VLDNVITFKPYPAGFVGYIFKSGAMSNDLNNIVSLVTNGAYEGIVIGGDCYPGSTFIAADGTAYTKTLSKVHIANYSPPLLIFLALNSFPWALQLIFHFAATSLLTLSS
jgi:hypothetical protein